MSDPKIRPVTGKLQIWKYPLEMTDKQILMMPRGSVILHLDVVRDVPTLWAHVSPSQEPTPVKIVMIGTGWDHDHDIGDHIGTVIIGGFVWHFFLPKHQAAITKFD